jgi:hypothetical protein
VPVVFLHQHQRIVSDDAGAIHQYSQVAEVFFTAFHEALHIRELSHVTRLVKGAAATTGDLVLDIPRKIGMLPVAECDIISIFRHA